MTYSKNLQVDDNNRKIHVATGFSTQDATSGTTLKSPLSVTTTETPIVFPSNAVEMCIVNTSIDLIISEVAGMARYFTLPANCSLSIQAMQGTTIYMKGSGATSTVSFFFRTI